MALTCPSCASRVPAGRLESPGVAARCGHCHAVLDLSSGASAASPGQNALPPQLRVLESGHGVTIVRRWFTWAYPFLALFCAGWTGMLLLWYRVASEQGIQRGAELPVLGAAAVGVALGYLAAAGFVNRTTITMDRDHISVRHGPLPWAGRVNLRTSALERVFITRKVLKNRGRGSTALYSVEGTLRDGRTRKLVRGLGAEEQALFIQRAIERHLGTTDRAAAFKHGG